jgi:hypothetical protein
MSHAAPHNAISATGQEQIITTPPEVAVESARSAQAMSVYAPVIPITQIPTNPRNAISVTGQGQIITTPPEIAVESGGSALAVSAYAPVIPITQIPTNPMPAGADGSNPAQIVFAHEFYSRSIPYPTSPG